MMNSIPWAFIRELTRLSWQDAAFGYHQQWFAWSDAVELACDYLLQGDDSAAVVELAGVSKVEAHFVGEMLDRLEKISVQDHQATTAEKWLYLHLAWLYERRSAVDDPLEEVEEIYAEFGYPDDMAPFVRYMPAADGYDPSLHSVDENYSKLISNWRSYLERKAPLFADGPPRAS
jgi:hypothetical protein